MDGTEGWSTLVLHPIAYVGQEDCTRETQGHACVSGAALAISQHSVTLVAYLGWGHVGKKQPIFNPHLLERVNSILPFPTGHWVVAGFAWALSLHRAGFPLGYT